MAVGGRLVRTGVLHYRNWGYALCEADGVTWQLDLPLPVPEGLIGRMVIVDGIRAGFDMIDVITIRKGPRIWVWRWVIALWWMIKMAGQNNARQWKIM